MSTKPSDQFCYKCLQFHGAQKRVHLLTEELLLQERKLSRMTDTNNKLREVLHKVKLLMEGSPKIAPMNDELILALVKDTLEKY